MGIRSKWKWWLYVEIFLQSTLYSKQFLVILLNWVTNKCAIKAKVYPLLRVLNGGITWDVGRWYGSTCIKNGITIKIMMFLCWYLEQIIID